MRMYPGKPPRFHQGHSLYFLTFCTFKRKKLLHLSGIPEFLIEELHFYSRKIKSLIAYTIMPDHIHLIIEVEEAEMVSDFLRDFKKYTSIEIRRMLIPQSIEIKGRLWQPGTMDHMIRMGWENRDYQNHLSYVFFNSIKHLGISPIDFPYHNFKDFVVQGVFDKDFCAIDQRSLSSFGIYE
jgi:REP element-mobilizing transposase RayT